ncbi:MAG: ABC transporter ATP-binding protein [Dehalococcoidales bacterium]|jgi:ABC-type lipoprotein export system ATPase subunit|nr:ABC transporter ATP-binding protein [Dehalococcoidales bacterium]
MLVFEKVTRKFDLTHNSCITPVNEISLRVERGEMIIITGRSGTGKTTLLNLAAGLVKPTSGRVLIDNNDLKSMPDQMLSTLRNQKIGFIFQFPSLLPSLNVQENVTLPAKLGRTQHPEMVKSRAENLLQSVGLALKASVYPSQLSAGEQKRAVIARALINEPQLILADEPTSDLDSQTENEIMELLRDINTKGVTFLIVTHNLQLVPFASRAFRMENGKLYSLANTD